MANGIDTSKRKPRQIRGTPSNSYSKRIAWIGLGIGIGFGILFNYTPLAHDIQTKWKHIFIQPTQEEIDRRFLIAVVPQKKSYEIDSIRKEQTKIFSER